MKRTLKSATLLETARRLRAQNQSAEASLAYEKYLRKNSTDAEVLYEMGLFLLQAERFLEAIQYFRKAKAFFGGFAPLLNNLGLAQLKAKLYREALCSFNSAIEINCTYFAAYFNRSLAYYELEEYEASLADLAKVLEVEPNAVDALVAKANVFRAMKDYVLADALYREAMLHGAPQDQIYLDLSVNYELQDDLDGAMMCVLASIEANSNSELAYQAKLRLHKKKGERAEYIQTAFRLADLHSVEIPLFLEIGSLLMDAGRYSDVILFLSRCNVTDAEASPVYSMLGVAYVNSDDYSEALEAFNLSLKLNPDNVVALVHKAQIIKATGNVGEAESLLLKALEAAPNHPEIQMELVGIYRDQLRIAEAELLLEGVLNKDPKNVAALGSKGLFLFDKGLWIDALAHFNSVLDIDEDNYSARYNSSLINLTLGKFEEGWKDYDARWYTHKTSLIAMNLRHLVRESINLAPNFCDIKNKNVLLLEEQGVGDNVMFASVIPDVLEVARSVKIFASARTLELYRKAFPKAEVFEEAYLGHYLQTEFDTLALFGSMCGIFRRSQESFTCNPYLVADPDKKDEWRRTIGALGCKIVGIAWRGGVGQRQQQGRSILLEDFVPLFERNDLVLVNIQHGNSSDDISEVCARYGAKIFTPPKEDIHALDGLLNLVAALDSVVTVQNTNVHLAGSLGISCHAIVPSVPEWRYGSKGSHMVWYPSVQLHRRSPEKSVLDIMRKISNCI